MSLSGSPNPSRVNFQYLLSWIPRSNTKTAALGKWHALSSAHNECFLPCPCHRQIPGHSLSQSPSSESPWPGLQNHHSAQNVPRAHLPRRVRLGHQGLQEGDVCVLCVMVSPGPSRASDAAWMSMSEEQVSRGQNSGAKLMEGRENKIKRVSDAQGAQSIYQSRNGDQEHRTTQKIQRRLRLMVGEGGFRFGKL